MFTSLIRAVLLAALALAARAESITMGWMAAITSWNTNFTVLQTPGWDTTFHPGAIVDIQSGSIFAEISGDPHRPREATGIFVGLRHDLLRKGPVALYGQASAGVYEAPSFLEYCASYEYQNGDCGAGSKVPEYCFWGAFNGGFGVRIRITRKFALDPARAEYIGPYGIGPRWRFSSGFRVSL